MDRIKNGQLRRTVKVEHFEDEVREARLRCFLYVLRRNCRFIRQKQ